MTRPNGMLLLLLCWAMVATAQTFPMLTSTTTCGGLPTVVLSATAPGGSSLLLGVSSQDSLLQAVSVMDDAGSTYAIAADNNLPGGSFRDVLFYALTLKGPVTKLTLTPNISATQFSVFAMVYTPGLIGLDQSVGVTGPSGDGQLTTPLVTNATEMLAIQFVETGNIIATSPPFTEKSEFCGDLWADARLPSPTTINASFSTNGNYTLQVATFFTALSIIPFPTSFPSGTLPGSYVISAAQSIQVSSTLSIAGNLTVSNGGTLSVPQDAALVVGGMLTLNGAYFGGGQVNATVVQVGPSSNFTLVVTSPPPTAGQSVLSVVVFSATSSLTGTFGALGSVAYTGTNPSCYTFGTLAQSTTATALTVTVFISSEWRPIHWSHSGNCSWRCCSCWNLVVAILLRRHYEHATALKSAKRRTEMIVEL